MERFKTVGIRNTIIISPSDLEVLVPNTIIVNSTLINWTLHDSIIKYKMIFKTKRNNTEAYTQAQETINKLQNILYNLDFPLKNNDRKINLIKISDKHFSYLIEFYFDIKNIEEFENLKSKLNLILLKEFENIKFYIEYTKDMELKTTTV